MHTLKRHERFAQFLDDQAGDAVVRAVEQSARIRVPAGKQRTAFGGRRVNALGGRELYAGYDGPSPMVLWLWHGRSGPIVPRVQEHRRTDSGPNGSGSGQSRNLDQGQK